MEKICGIYCIENVRNKKKYIGLSTNIYKRWIQHRADLNNNHHINQHLQSAWNIFGEDNFSFEIIEICSKDMLSSREIYYIDLYKTTNNQYGYNQTSGGDGINNLSPKCAEKISIAESLYPVLQIDINNGSIIKLHRNCAKAAISIGGNTENIRTCCLNKYGRKSYYGYIWIYEKDYNEKTFSIEKYKKTKKHTVVDMYELNGKFIQTFNSAIDAEKVLNISRKLISSVCHGHKRQTHGYIFRIHGEPFDKYNVYNRLGTLEPMRS